jgi:hypothetical protein
MDDVEAYRFDTNGEGRGRQTGTELSSVKATKETARNIDTITSILFS